MKVKRRITNTEKPLDPETKCTVYTTASAASMSRSIYSFHEYNDSLCVVRMGCFSLSLPFLFIIKECPMEIPANRTDSVVLSCLCQLATPLKPYKVGELFTVLKFYGFGFLFQSLISVELGQIR